jgi:hypothetical protein
MVVLQLSRISGWISACAGTGILLSVASALAAERISIPEHLQQGQLVVGHARGCDDRIRRTQAACRWTGRSCSASIVMRRHRRRWKSYADGSKTTRKLQVARTYHIQRVECRETVTPDPTAARIEREQAAVAEARKHDDAREDFLHGFALPVQGARISGVYGSQRIDNGTPKAPHMGLDLAVAEGTPIHAPAAGIVTFAEPDLVLTGGTVLIDHGFGLTSAFLHMSRLDVKAGERIERGQVFGAAGMTGRASGHCVGLQLVRRAPRSGVAAATVALRVRDAGRSSQPARLKPRHPRLRCRLGLLCRSSAMSLPPETPIAIRRTSPSRKRSAVDQRRRTLFRCQVEGRCIGGYMRAPTSRGSATTWPTPATW